MSLGPEPPLIEWRPPSTRPVRMNAEYELWPVAAMSSPARGALGDAGAQDTDHVLVPHGRQLLPKLVDGAAAQLLRALREWAVPPSPARAHVPRLVLEGILGYEGPSGFVTGAAALDVFADECVRAPVGWTSGLSATALAYADRLQPQTVDVLTSRLYRYHRSPATRRWRHRFGGEGAVLAMIPAVLRDQWICRPSSPSWLPFVRPGTPAGPLPYKVYVSPVIDELPDVLPTVVDALARTSAPRFKIGANTAGLLRPDKLVVYLPDADAVDEVVAALHGAIGTARPHGVPFSAPLGRSGLVSWGGDPAHDAAPVGRRAESWRLSVCRRLAEGLVAAGDRPLRRVRPIDVALTRLSADGVDVQTFAPSSLPPPRTAARAA